MMSCVLSFTTRRAIHAQAIAGILVVLLPNGTMEQSPSTLGIQAIQILTGSLPTWSPTVWATLIALGPDAIAAWAWPIQPPPCLGPCTLSWPLSIGARPKK